jgi:hypothetical protein
MTEKNFTNATGNWNVSDDGNISYLGGTVGVQELDIESGRLTAYADPIPEYVYGDEPNRAFLWRNPVTGTILGFDKEIDTIARSTDNGATWHYVDSPLEIYGPYVKVKGEYEPGADFIGTNTDGSMILFGPGEGNMFSTDDGLTWSLWSGMPKGVLEGTQKILYNEETDTWRVLGSLNTTSALMLEFQGSDPNVYLGNSFNSNWAPYSRAMIMDNGQILFNNHSWGYTQSDGSYQTSLTLLKDSSSVEDDNVSASYVFRLEDVDYGSDVGRPSFNHGKDLQGRNMGAVAYTRSNNTLGIRTTIDGQNWTDLSDQLGDLPLVAQNGMISILWLEGRQEWLVFATKLSKGGNWWPQPGDAYVFKSSIPGDLTSLVDVTYNAFVGSRVQYAVGSDLGVWIAPKQSDNTNIAIKDITETNPPNLDLYWDGEKLATEPYVDSLARNVQTDLTNCVKIEVPGFTEQSIGGFRIKLNTESVKLGYINDYGNPANQTEMSYLSGTHVTSILTPGADYINEFPTTISINRTKSYTQNDRDFGAFTTDWLKPNRFRDKVEIDLDPTGDFDAVNKKYVDGVIGGSSLWEQNGSDIYYNDGSVGIGTDAPAAQIEVKGKDKIARFEGASDKHFLEVNFVPQYNEVQLNTNATYFNLAKNGQVGFFFDGNLEGNFLYACSIGNIRIDGEKMHGKGLNGDPGIGFYLSGKTHEILPIDYLGRELTEGPDFGNSTYKFGNGHFHGAVQATDFQNASGDSLPSSPTVSEFVTLTQSQYESLSIKNSNTIYFITGGTVEGGITWTDQKDLAQVVDSWSYTQMESLIWTATQFMVVGNRGQCATSRDGVTWTYQPGLHSVVDFSTMYEVVWNGFKFCAVGMEGACATSPDGVTWTLRPSLASADWMYALTWSPTHQRFCTVGSSGACATSPDGVTWTRQPGLKSAVGSSGMHSLIWTASDKRYITVGENGKCATSTDGFTWTNQPSFTSAVDGAWMHSVIWTGKQFCAVGESGKCATSSDGVTWTNQPGFTKAVGDTQKMRSVIWDGTQFMSVGDMAVCATSPDGVTWTAQPSLASAMDAQYPHMYGVVWTGTQYCAVGDKSICATGIRN